MKNEIRDYPPTYGEPSTRRERCAIFALVVAAAIILIAVSVTFGIWLGSGQ